MSEGERKWIGKGESERKSECEETMKDQKKKRQKSRKEGNEEIGEKKGKNKRLKTEKKRSGSQKKVKMGVARLERVE